MVRLFIALALPDWLKTRIATLREEWPGFQWVPPEQLHLTLKYIGDVPDGFLEEITASLQDLSTGDFLLELNGLKTFSTRKGPVVLWLDVPKPHPHCLQLQKRVEDLCFRHGIEPERRIFQPHVTVARVGHANPETVRQFIKHHPDVGFPPVRIEAFHLYRSDPTESGRFYHIIHSFSLRSAFETSES